MQERYELEVKLRDYPDVMTLKELIIILPLPILRRTLTPISPNVRNFLSMIRV